MLGIFSAIQIQKEQGQRKQTLVACTYSNFATNNKIFYIDKVCSNVLDSCTFIRRVGEAPIFPRLHLNSASWTDGWSIRERVTSPPSFPSKR